MSGSIWPAFLWRKIMRRNWTLAEIDYMQNNWGDVSIKHIATKLKRSINSVKIKAYKVGLRRMTDCGEYITFNQLFNIINGKKEIGKDFKRLIKAKFPMNYQRIINKQVKVVYMDKFWDWFEQNKHLIDLKHTNKGDFGYEPAWVDEKRRADKRAAEYKTTPWTAYEDECLQRLLKTYKYGYREISIKLKRTEGALKRRMQDLKIKERPLRADNHNPWTYDEIEKVKKLYLKGYKSQIIAEYIDRSALAINGLLERHNYFKGF